METVLGGQGQLRQVFRENLPLALRLKETISKYTAAIVAREKSGHVKIMNFCGTHEWTTTRYGLRDLLPPSLELVAGPGCPVCVTPSYYVDLALKLAAEGTRVYTYGDVLRLRSVKSETPASLEEVRAEGGNVKVVYSFLDAVKDASRYGNDSVFLAIGFETTVPSYALTIREGMVPENLKLLSAARLTPPAMKYTLKLYQERDLRPINGVIAPGHVSTIIGAAAWNFLPLEYALPTVVTGFEPIDVLMAVAQILLMIKNGKPATEIEYKRLVSWEGNKYAMEAIENIFEVSDSAWRGIGFIPKSGLRLRGKFFEEHDALKHFALPDLTSDPAVIGAHLGVPWQSDMPPRCRCADVVVGIAKPTDCPMFLNGCTTMKPWGPCMVSSEGTCNVWARHGSENHRRPSESELGG